MSFETQNEGWGLKLISHYSGKVDILCRGFSGYNTRLAKLMTPVIFGNPSLVSRELSLITILWGANDAVVPGFSQHIPLEEYKQNLSDIFDSILQHHPNVKIIFITPPAIDDDAHLIHFKDNSRRNEVTGEYAKGMISVAKDKGALYLDLWKEFQEVENYSSFLVDGLHLSNKGNSFLFKTLMQFIDRELPHLSSDSLSFEFPYWKLVDFQNPESILKDKEKKNIPNYQIE